MVLERYDNRISIGHVIVFLVIAVALGAYLAFVTGPHLREAIDAGEAAIAASIEPTGSPVKHCSSCAALS